ncbi:Acyl-CoA synthetase [Ceraceosorus bombacis]|uniref:Acyl-CoA synthetase n=1 Tax=Ceraceosorus bombacis TaxID=401625 RepID=A0A0P1BRN4_9BASI|nr:Acyl-CoA synthetase [Ceraceosorus bombacis]
MSSQGPPLNPTVYDAETKIFSSELVKQFPPPTAKTVWSLLMGDAEGDEEHVVFIDTEDGTEWKLGQLRVLAERLGAGLTRDAQIPAGSVVMLLLPNSIHFIVALLAAQYAGLTVALANPAYTTHELSHCLRLTKPVRIFSVSKLLGLATRSGATWSQCIVMDTHVGYGTIFWRECLKSAEEAGEAKPREVDPSSVAYLPFSSGTTGLPKAVCISHANIAAMCHIISITPGAYDRGVRSIGFLPFFHAMALLLMIHMPIYRRGTIYIMASFNPARFLHIARNAGCTDLSLVPPIFTMLVTNADIPRDSLKSVRTIRCGAAPLDSAMQVAFAEKFGIEDIRQGWGMTETTVGCLGLAAGSTPGTVGNILPFVQARIVDPESGKDVERGESGELWVKGPNIMQGYHANPQATTQAFSDGWLRTGDVVFANERGEFTIIDRIKELIKYKGWQVAPAELEGLLLSHPKVVQAGVIGIYDRKQGTELPRAYIKVQNSSNEPEELVQELQAFVARKASAQKQLRGGIRIVDAVPVSPSGKVLRKLLRAMVQKEEAAEKDAMGASKL